MKKIYLILILFILLTSCYKKSNVLEEKKDLQFFPCQSYILSNDNVKKFIIDFTNQPQNANRRLYTLYVDQRMDTLLFTIWKYPGYDFEFINAMGFINYQNKVIILYSPFSTIIKTQINDQIFNELSKVLKYDYLYGNTDRTIKFMWQLQIPIGDTTYNIVKDFNTIANTVKPPIPLQNRE